MGDKAVSKDLFMLKYNLVGIGRGKSVNDFQQ